MSDSNVFQLNTPPTDALNEALKQGARELLAKAIEGEAAELLAFYDYPAQHWTHIRTSNPFESALATVRLRTNKTKSCGSRKTTLTMTYKLAVTAENNWRRLRGFRLLADVVRGVKFKDGETAEEGQQQDTAMAAIHQN